MAAFPAVSIVMPSYIHIIARRILLLLDSLVYAPLSIDNGFVEIWC